jgi:hypothetical protein
MSELDEIKQQMRNDQQFMAIENGNALQWMIKFQEELRKTNTDNEIVANTSRGYLHSMKKVLETAVNVRPGSEILTKHLSIFTEKLRKYEQAYKDKQIGLTVAITSNVMEWLRNIFPEAEAEFNKSVSDINKKSQLWTQIFYCCYIIASALFGYSWWQENLKKY